MLGLGLGLTSPASIGGGAPSWGPYTGATLDLDFVAQKYWWGGALKTTADFTTYTLSGSTFGANGLTPTDTIDWTLTLAGVGTVVPGALAISFRNTTAPASAKQWFAMSDGTTANQIFLLQNTNASIQGGINTASVSQASIPSGGATTALATTHGYAIGYATNDFKAAANGTALTADSAGTLPTLTTLRIGKGVTALAPLGVLGRLVLFASAKTQAELNALSVALRDGVII